MVEERSEIRNEPFGPEHIGVLVIQRSIQKIKDHRDEPGPQIVFSNVLKIFVE